MLRFDCILHGLRAPVLRCARRPPTRALFARSARLFFVAPAARQPGRCLHAPRACSSLRPPPANPGAVCTAYARLFFVAPKATG
ncbi:MAG: hypothetical protein DU429_02930 [Candidatus Tokpelaia sp.]|nr:MAG: hypothetical protein DU430_05685 [Candidatus Tokpelaia sp.]KAA6207421.1 MAG: hypothetical protein DU429_02930 [Candidatus Tokpelaia sp.]